MTLCLDLLHPNLCLSSLLHLCLSTHPHHLSTLPLKLHLCLSNRPHLSSHRPFCPQKHSFSHCFCEIIYLVSSFGAREQFSQLADKYFWSADDIHC